MLMPWGKFKGHDISMIPDSYLLWLNFTAEIQEELLSSAIQDELVIRFPDRVVYRESPVTQNHNDYYRERLRSVYRELAQEYHPDHGGNTRAMQAINAFYQMMQE